LLFRSSFHKPFLFLSYPRLAKEKRERLRHAHLAPDYIPLHSVTRTMGRHKGGGKTGAAAETREGTGEATETADRPGSESDEDPEEMMRLKFTAETAK